ncbi:MAG: hypothetical protein R3F07_19040 [Opitutaceae bacterium]
MNSSVWFRGTLLCSTTFAAGRGEKGLGRCCQQVKPLNAEQTGGVDHPGIQGRSQALTLVAAGDHQRPQQTASPLRFQADRADDLPVDLGDEAMADDAVQPTIGKIIVLKQALDLHEIHGVRVAEFVIADAWVKIEMVSSACPFLEDSCRMARQHPILPPPFLRLPKGRSEGGLSRRSGS